MFCFCCCLCACLRVCSSLKLKQDHQSHRYVCISSLPTLYSSFPSSFLSIILLPLPPPLCFHPLSSPCLPFILEFPPSFLPPLFCSLSLFYPTPHTPSLPPFSWDSGVLSTNFYISCLIVSSCLGLFSVRAGAQSVQPALRLLHLLWPRLHPQICTANYIIKLLQTTVHL